MKWFKHDSDASSDAKLKKLILRHGATGYAVYFHCLELIASDLTQTNITFELEHDAEIIADNLKITGNTQTAGIDIVNKILLTILDLKLFESDGARIFCYKMAYRLDNTISRAPEINLIKKKRSSNVVATKQKRREEIRTDKKRLEEKREENIIQIPSYLKSVIGFNENWIIWLDYRKQLKKPLKEITQTAQLKKLSKMVDPIGSINQSIENGWIGLFEIKQNNGAGKIDKIKNNYNAGLDLLGIQK